MRLPRLRLATPLLLAAVVSALLACACGGGTSMARPQRGAAATVSASLRDWPEFGLDPQRSDATDASPGIDAADLPHLRRRRIALPGTVDSSPIYLHGVNVAGAVRDVIVVTTTYGRTLAIDASDGRILWTFTPPGYSGWAGSAQITTASPIADPDRRFVYAASPNGLVHKLSLASGAEDRRGSWPVSVTRDPTHEKLAAALNIDGPDVLVATGGYIGDIPPYQGHLVLISRAHGTIRGIFNTLCADRRELMVPSSCPASDSAILSRGGPVVEPGGRRILIDTGNAPWNGTTDFGDSVLELTFPGLRLRQSFTPANQEYLNTSDTDLGSSAPALLGEDRAVLAGKDGIMRVLALSRLDGHPPSGDHRVLGGEVQRLPIPGGGQLFTAPAVWRHGGRTTVFVAGFAGTGAYALRGGRLHPLWTNATAGTSPLVAGGLVYVYDPNEGGIDVYRPGSPHPLAKLPGSPGHWNSPIVVDGHIVEPEGNANAHETSGTLDLFSVG
ncbi:MAG TPA: PQQ-binding-like beta-propeller repeat protein [Solirubrobacteraceae bacterium]|nr:PQQ-binding-like beta-propeller repeat protein [Solirubrobacteraceae bacterium]